MDSKEYQEQILSAVLTLPDQLTPEQKTMIHACIGLTTEAGEVADILKRHLFYGEPLIKEEILEEAGDTLWYLVLALSAVGLTLDQVMEANMEKLKIRYASGKRKRNEEAEGKAIRSILG